MRHLEPKLFTKMKPGARAQRQWANLAHPFGNKTGQTLVELAVFGTVLLFCLTLFLRYAMSATYQQNLGMQTFRKAFVRARQSESPSGEDGWWRWWPGNPDWGYENTDPPCPSDRWRNVSYTVIEDKPVHSASGILPITERAPVGAATGAVWSINMFGGVKYGDNEHLPRVEYEINGRRYSFTTAAFKETNPLPAKKRVTVEDYKQKGVPSWRWTPNDEFWQEDKGSLSEEQKDRGWKKGDRLYYWGDYLDEDGKEQWGEEQLRIGDTADFDGDNEEEAVINFLVYCHKKDKVTTDDHDKYDDKKCDKAHDIIAVQLMDYQEGEVDLTDYPGIKERGGLQGDYSKTMKVINSTFTRQETASGITTIDNINAQETFKRIIKTRDGDYNVEDELPTQKTETWYTPHK